MIVSVDLLARGYEVFRSLSPATSCDLAILKDGRLLRVEVTTGARSPRGRIYHNHKQDAHLRDILAVVLGSEVHYTPSLPEPKPLLAARIHGMSEETRSCPLSSLH